MAINLPENIKKRLLEFGKKWEHLPVRWTKKDSLHLTLVFIGYVSNEEMLEICRITRDVALKFEPFNIGFKHILCGPINKPPRMIWLKGKANAILVEIKKELEEALTGSGKIGAFRIENRPFSPHITLARIKMGQWHNLPEQPEIDQEFKFSVPVSSLDVMESDLRGDGAEYTILESCPLGGE